MGKDAPDERAQKLADKIMGKPPADAEVANMLAGNVMVGQRGEDGKPIGEKVTAEEFRSNRSKPNRRSAQSDDYEGGDDTEEEIDDDFEDEAEDEEGPDDDADEEAGSEPDDEEGDDGEEAGDDDEDGYEEVAYSDDDVIDVKVDGAWEEVSLRDLKRAYSLAGATEKRLAEATDLRNSAQAERETAAKEIQTHRANMLRTIQQLDHVLFSPLVSEPDPKLRLKNMNEYLLQKDAFEEDQKRIAMSRNQLTQFLSQEHQQLQTHRGEFRTEQQKLLAQKMPDLLDPEKTGKIQKDILDAAVHYGFSPQQVAEVDHHGLFLMARDAARWLNMQKIKKNGTVPHDGEKATVRRRKRHLKAGGGATSSKTRAVRNNKEQIAATKRAQTTGRVDDVANMLMSKARTRGKSNGRSRQNV